MFRHLQAAGFVLLIGCAGQPIDRDADGVPEWLDCDDADPARGPGAIEVCNGIDDDCDALVDDSDPSVEGAHARFEDADGDGFGTELRAYCSATRGAARGGDCDDDAPWLHPEAPEVCNGIDDDCDGAVDDEDPEVLGVLPRFVDRDGDGAAGTEVLVCSETTGALFATDCDDYNPERHRGAQEVCGSVDWDCDGVVGDLDDSTDANTMLLLHPDLDADGYGDEAVEELRCPTPGWIERGGDCGDGDPGVHPEATELCDALDNDCNGRIDDEDPGVVRTDPLWLHEDADLDSYGNEAVVAPRCEAGAGWVVDATDCDDTTDLSWPGAPELCDGLDNDCDQHPDQVDRDGGDGLLGCDLCPSVEQVPDDVVSIRRLNPCLLDPPVDNLCEAPQSHSDGTRVHKVATRTDLTEFRETLFLFLPPETGNNNYNVVKWAAEVGFKAINLGYDNSLKVSRPCGILPDPCYGPVHLETFQGTPETELVDIGAGDSIEGRLTTLLEYLAISEPEANWEQHLDPVTKEVLWETVLVAGWSAGSGVTGMTARERSISALLMLSGPQNFVQDEPFMISEWMTDHTFATPACKMRGAFHADEIQQSSLEFTVAWDAMGIDTSEIYPLAQGWPWDPEIAVFSNGLQSFGASHCTPHKSMAFDVCMHEDLRAHYENLYCVLDSPVVRECDGP